ncbi:hypothetical protein EIN_041410 [Entamoeba invadens IP1]|uniref:Uncharacterized protein n=1 Tax=Entamoeba invadens IP1 TaxID=370355 RepID=A0A0A1TWF3_ENTIV|nr:hypothetical protein EIN_041410 [Entamoeba invadens IP1]ELP85497.1 hypothetical protein EIN_041410 [Entamoeba invadens IP1]|eukprot:XP_004184843.1 hypothetical protein EIN_041410 [Entamoeba invadens IP1]
MYLCSSSLPIVSNFEKSLIITPFASYSTHLPHSQIATAEKHYSDIIKSQQAFDASVLQLESMHENLMNLLSSFKSTLTRISNDRVTDKTTVSNFIISIHNNTIDTKRTPLDEQIKSLETEKEEKIAKYSLHKDEKEEFSSSQDEDDKFPLMEKTSVVNTTMQCSQTLWGADIKHPNTKNDVADIINQSIYVPNAYLPKSLDSKVKAVNELLYGNSFGASQSLSLKMDNEEDENEEDEDEEEEK